MQQLFRRYALSALSLSVLTGALIGTSANAYPQYAKKEGKPCIYCHVKPNGGRPNNYRGLYYKMHELSFKEFDDAAEAKKAGEEIGPEATPNPTSYTPPAASTAPVAAKPETPVVPTKKVPTLVELTSKAATAKTAYTMKKTPETTKAYAVALADLGHAQMLDQKSPPRLRYPTALKTLREAVTIDPTNKEAAADKKLIEDAYKQMGRPLPK